MFDNICETIKITAKILLLIETAIAVVAAVQLFNSAVSPFWAWTVLIAGPLVSLLNSFLLYGFGELIESFQQQELFLKQACDMLINTPDPS